MALLLLLPSFLLMPVACHCLCLCPTVQVDVLVSEPMGTLLVNERMIESYVYARDKHLKPGGESWCGLVPLRAALGCA